MQLARMILGEYEKSISRKWAEIVVTIQLEQRLSKEEIFAYYANDYHLGAHGSFQIYGFGEGAEAYFGKDLSQINLPEAAALAGMIQRPSAFDPYRHPDRLKERRNVVLGLMRQNGYISDRDYALAIQAPVVVARGAASSTEAPYYVDLVGEELQTKLQDADFQSNAARIYTTLDMRLQRAAADAIRAGMQNVDEQIRETAPFPRTDAARTAGGVDRNRSAHWRRARAGWGAQLWRQPVEPYSGQAPAWVDLQALRLRHRHGYRN